MHLDIAAADFLSTPQEAYFDKQVKKIHVTLSQYLAESCFTFASAPSPHSHFEGEKGKKFTLKRSSIIMACKSLKFKTKNGNGQLIKRADKR